MKKKKKKELIKKENKKEIREIDASNPEELQKELERLAKEIEDENLEKDKLIELLKSIDIEVKETYKGDYRSFSKLKRFYSEFFDNVFIEISYEIIIGILVSLPIIYFLKPFKTNILMALCFFLCMFVVEFFIKLACLKWTSKIYYQTLGLIKCVFLPISFILVLIIFKGFFEFELSSIGRVILSGIILYSVRWFIYNYIRRLRAKILFYLSKRGKKS